MNAIQLPFLVEAVLLLVAMVLGGFLGRKGKPYGKVKLGFHLFFFLWFTMGYYFIAQGLFTESWTALEVLVAVMGLALATQLVSGLVLLFRKAAVPWLPIVHGSSAALVLVADLAALILAAG